jgi:hypothetical protein
MVFDLQVGRYGNDNVGHVCDRDELALAQGASAVQGGEVHRGEKPLAPPH